MEIKKAIEKVRKETIDYVKKHDEEVYKILTEKEWNLSKWIRKSQHPLAPYCTVNAIKEFIQRETSLICLILAEGITEQEFWKRRDKLAGEDLC